MLSVDPVRGRRQHPRLRAVGEASRTREGGESGPEMDPALWGQLQRYVDVEKVAAQLPLHAFYAARRVCRSWDALPGDRLFLEQHSTTSLPKPYFVLYGRGGCHQALLLKGVENWTLKELPTFPFRSAHTSVVRGVVQTCWHSRGAVNITVFNLHTKVFHRLPPLPVASNCFCCSHLAVDCHSSNSYKLLVACSKDRGVFVYDSQTGVWAARAPSPVKLYDEDGVFVAGAVYIKWRGDVGDVRRAPSRYLDGVGRAPEPQSVPKIVRYSFKDDAWSAVPMTPPALVMTEENREMVRADGSSRGLGEWRGALRDVTYDEEGGGVVRVWEFAERGQQWREVDRMPEGLLAWLFDPRPTLYSNLSLRRIIKTCYCGDSVLISSNHFSGAHGPARLVLYDMALRTWETPTVAKNWICPCPFGV